MKFLKIGILCSVLFAINSCKKDPGPGGLATVKGKVFAIDITTAGNVKDSGYIAEQKVYISVSGDADFFDSKRTSYDGSYEFNWLRKGTYDVWSFSDCDTCVWKQQKVLKTVEVGSKKATVTVDDLKIIF
jgi:hypothetical protein